MSPNRTDLNIGQQDTKFFCFKDGIREADVKSWQPMDLGFFLGCKEFDHP